MASVRSLTRDTVRRHAESDAIGVYKLFNSRKGPVRYVGRSSDVQQRLLNWASSSGYSFFSVEHMESLREAWKREAHLYHYHKPRDNKRHPQAPEGMSCPVCSRV